jgi:hypothetical protein
MDVDAEPDVGAGCAGAAAPAAAVAHARRDSRGGDGPLAAPARAGDAPALRASLAAWLSRFGAATPFCPASADELLAALRCARWGRAGAPAGRSPGGGHRAAAGIPRPARAF